MVSGELECLINDGLQPRHHFRRGGRKSARPKTFLRRFVAAFRAPALGGDDERRPASGGVALAKAVRNRMKVVGDFRDKDHLSPRGGPRRDHLQES
jgi:hypothetical protein